MPKNWSSAKNVLKNIAITSIDISGYTGGDSRAEHPDFDWHPGHFDGIFELEPGEAVINIDVISSDSNSERYSISIKRINNTTDILETKNKLPVEYKLNNNFPNPFNPSTKIIFEIPDISRVKLIVYNLLGQEISLLVNKELSAGIYEYTWNASNFPSGIYIYRLIANEFVSTKKMVLVK